MSTDCGECGCIPCVCDNTLELEQEIANLTTALNDLLEKAKLCKECNQVFNSLSEAIEQAEKVVEGKV